MTCDTPSELVITRVFDAPVELVWKAWSEGDRMARWWGPKGLELRIAKLDFARSGIFHYAIEFPNGAVMWGKFVYLEIEPPSKLVFVSSFADKNENNNCHSFMPDWPIEVHNTLVLQEQDGKTVLTLRGVPVNPTAAELNAFIAARPNVEKGFAGTFDQLVVYLASP